MCSPPCANGVCVANDTCSCSEGYTGERCTDACELNHSVEGQTSVTVCVYVCACVFIQYVVCVCVCNMCDVCCKGGDSKESSG